MKRQGKATRDNHRIRHYHVFAPPPHDDAPVEEDVACACGASGVRVGGGLRVIRVVEPPRRKPVRELDVSLRRS